jgi:hypothetical protein
VVLPRSPEPGAPKVDDDSTTTARLAYRTALAQKQTARLTLAVTTLTLGGAVLKTIIKVLM